MTKTLWFTLAMLMAGISVGVYSGRMPWDTYRTQQAAADRATTDMQQAESRIADLIRLESRVHSTIGKQELARKQGYLNPGEVPLNVR